MENWETVELQDVCRIINGRAYKKSELLDEGKYRVLRVGNFFTNKQWYYSNLELDEDKYCDNGDLLYAWSASFGPRIWEGEKVIYHYHIWKMEPNEEHILKEYLHKFLLWDTEKIKSEQGVGTTMIHVTKGSMEERELPIPPLPEQKQIVAILDEAFEVIDQAKANVERNIKNAEELFQSKLNEIFSQRGEGWEEESLKKISKIMYGYTDKSSSEFGGPKYLRITDIQDNSVDWDNVPHCHHMEDEYEKYQLHYGDIVFARTGATTGKSYLVIDPPKAVFASYLIRVQADLELLKPDFLYWYFQCPKYWRVINEGISGSAQGGFNATKLGKLRIPIPPTNTQDQIVEEVNDLYEAFDSLVSTYKQKLEGIEELKKSILQKAFSGELTANEHVAA